MAILNLRREEATVVAAQVPDFFYATGPLSYDYQFGDRSLFDPIVAEAWQTPGTLYSFDCAAIIKEHDKVIALLSSFHSPEFRPRVKALSKSNTGLLARGEIDRDSLFKLADRADKASWLNPKHRAGIYYINAIAVDPNHRGEKLGFKLMMHARDQAKKLGYSAIDLDVLSNNSAVSFYQSLGFEILCETRATEPYENGVPSELRMSMEIE